MAVRRCAGHVCNYQLPVVCDFPNVKFEPGKEWDPQNPTYVPIPPATIRCEKGCCTSTTIPLRVCKAITTYKSQGMSVGEGQIWTKIVLVLGSLKGFNAPGMEQVGFSRAQELHDMALDSNSPEDPITTERLRRIGTTPAYEKRRDWMRAVSELQAQTAPVMMKMIAELDESEGKDF